MTCLCTTSQSYIEKWFEETLCYFVYRKDMVISQEKENFLKLASARMKLAHRTVSGQVLKIPLTPDPGTMHMCLTD